MEFTDGYIDACKALYAYDLAIKDLQKLSEVMADNGVKADSIKAYRDLIGELYTRKDEQYRKLKTTKAIRRI